MIPYKDEPLASERYRGIEIVYTMNRASVYPFMGWIPALAKGAVEDTYQKVKLTVRKIIDLNFKIFDEHD